MRTQNIGTGHGSATFGRVVSAFVGIAALAIDAVMLRATIETITEDTVLAIAVGISGAMMTWLLATFAGKCWEKSRPVALVAWAGIVALAALFLILRGFFGVGSGTDAATSLTGLLGGQSDQDRSVDWSQWGVGAVMFLLTNAGAFGVFLSQRESEAARRDGRIAALLDELASIDAEMAARAKDESGAFDMLVEGSGFDEEYESKRAQVESFYERLQTKAQVAMAARFEDSRDLYEMLEAEGIPS